MSNKKLIFGAILICLGALLLLRTLDIFFFGFGEVLQVLMPLGLIALGIWLIVRRRRREREADTESNFRYHTAHFTSTTAQTSPSPPPPPPTPSPSPPRSASASAGQAQPESDTGTSEPEPEPPPGVGATDTGQQQAFYPGRAKYSKIFGDLLIDCCNISLQNVEISGFVGDVEIRLHGAKPVPGLNRVVISDFIGDIRVLVPRGMAVFANCSNFAGDIELFGRRSSGLGNSLDGQTANYQEAESKLYIAANTFVGDIRIYEV